MKQTNDTRAFILFLKPPNTDHHSSKTTIYEEYQKARSLRKKKNQQRPDTEPERCTQPFSLLLLKPRQQQRRDAAPEDGKQREKLCFKLHKNWTLISSISFIAKVSNWNPNMEFGLQNEAEPKLRKK